MSCLLREHPFKRDEGAAGRGNLPRQCRVRGWWKVEIRAVYNRNYDAQRGRFRCVRNRFGHSSNPQRDPQAAEAQASPDAADCMGAPLPHSGRRGEDGLPSRGETGNMGNTAMPLASDAGMGLEFTPRCRSRLHYQLVIDPSGLKYVCARAVTGSVISAIIVSCL
jgi:hypothetical protein